MYIKNQNIVLRKVLPSYFLVDITKCYNNTEQKMFITDEMGAEIWNIMNSEDTFEMVYSRLLEKLVDEKTEDLKACVREDLQEYLQLLLDQECIYEV